ncbi:hypothetical protein CHCC14819_0445 [Bacillus licheniformis]|uniref:phage tail spike protein n=1 Tax=Bacillus licheniformis TaxID=1402 RepID=UPI0011A0F2A8|nr:phage tail spike protein [Bacillus licheniformis]TWM32249.1 hypothetical protein CHCC14819_0445 [Bacillus licheniformis]
MLFILDSKQNTIGVASNSNPHSLPYMDDVHTENLEGVNTYEFSVPSDHSDSKLFEVEGHVIIRNLDGEHLLFTIKNITNGTADGKRVKNIMCEETAVSELLSDVQRPATFNSATLESVVKSILANTVDWKLGEVPFTESKDFEFTEYITVLEALRTVVTEFDKEVYFTVRLSGTKIVEKLVNIVDQRGSETGVRFDYTYDLKGVSRVEDSSKIVTALVGVGKGDSNSVRVNLSGVDAFVDGDFYKEAGADWIGSESALQRWGKNGHHRFGVYVDEEADTAEELKRRTLKELAKRIEPDVTYSSSVATLERLTGYDAKKLRLGDTIVINDKSFEPFIVINGRVKELKRSYTRTDSDEVELGNYKAITLSPNMMIRDLQNVITRNQEMWKSTAAVREQIADIDNRTSDVQIIQTVVYSPDFESIMSDKANVEDISDMATGEMLTQYEENTIKYIDGRLDGEGGINEAINAVSSQLEKTANQINARFSSSGGVNLIKNSIGYAGLELWELKAGSITTLQNQELEQLGFGSGFKSVPGRNAYMEQVVNITPGKKHSLSFWMKKTKDNIYSSWAGIDIWANGQKIAFIGKDTGAGVTNGWELGLYTFETEYSEVTIRVTFGANVEAVMSGLMLNIGDYALQWQHANGEVYNTNVQMNLNGIKVINGQTNGYTIMSPEEFSGYAEVLDDQNNLVMKRVFTLNDDTTEVTRLNAEEEVNMGSIRILNIDANGSKGWAFVANN